MPVLGGLDDPKLPAESIDLAIMVDVYHEFSEPQKMLQRLREAIKPGGRLVLLEYRAEDPDVPILREHKMTKAQVKLEVEHEGFKQSRVYDDLPWQLSLSLHAIVDCGYKTRRVTAPLMRSDVWTAAPIAPESGARSTNLDEAETDTDLVAQRETARARRDRAAQERQNQS